MNDDKTARKLTGEMMMGGANTKTPDPTMWKILVVLDFPGTMLKFMFRNEARMLETRALLRAPKLLQTKAIMVNGATYEFTEIAPVDEVEVEDDCGEWCRVNRSRIVAVSVCDISREADGDADAAMIQALKQADLARRAQADSRLAPGKVMVPGSQKLGRG